MKPEYIIPVWPAPKNISCMTTTRNCGYSKGVYKSLNLGIHVDDEEIDVEKNRQLIKQSLSLPDEPIWLDQVHGSEVINPLDANNKTISADGAYTNEVEVVCVVLTADCLPVLFCDRSGEYIAAVHAGWRGLVGGVLENTLNALPANNTDIMCWLGPAIGPDRFEVGSEVVEQFIEKLALHKNSFQSQDSSKYLADIYQLAKNILITSGVKDIYGSKYCTYTQEDKFYSHRREGQTGRMATLIWKK
ncbi:MAG: peptidoglycan editing factor PgeF [Gammaproteobacteria bacterium]